MRTLHYWCCLPFAGWEVAVHLQVASTLNFWCLISNCCHCCHTFHTCHSGKCRSFHGLVGHASSVDQASGRIIGKTSLLRDINQWLTDFLALMKMQSLLVSLHYSNNSNKTSIIKRGTNGHLLSILFTHASII